MNRVLLIVSLLSFIYSCGKSAGIENSSETTNGFVATAVDANGVPVAGAAVSIWEADSREREPLATTTTNSSGGFTIAAEMAGQYRLQVVKEGIGYSSIIEKTRELLPVKKVSLFDLSTMQFRNSEKVSLQVYLLGSGVDTTIAPGETVSLQLPVSEHYETAINDGTTEQELSFDLRLYDTGSVEVTDISQELSFQGADGYVLDSLIMVDFMQRHGIAMSAWDTIVGISGDRIRVLTLDNRVTAVGPSVSNLSFLWRLLMPNNPGITLADEITKLDKLTELELSGCGLHAVPEQVKELDELKTLNLNGNKLSTLPSWLNESSSIGNLFLSDNAFESFPIQLTHMTNLGSLALSGNTISSLNGIESMSGLTHVFIENCGLMTISPLYGLTDITYLKAPENNITDLTGISNLSKLNELWLGNNNLEDLPEELFTIKSLTHLYLNDNDLSTMSLSIGSLTNLVKLKLESNDIVTLPDEIANLTSLEKIFVGYNRLGTQTQVVTDFLNEKAEDNWATNQK